MSALNTNGYSSTCLAMGFANVRAGTQKRRGALAVSFKYSSTRLYCQDVHQLQPRPDPGPFLGTRPNISESHSEISTRVPVCIAAGAGRGGAQHAEVLATEVAPGIQNPGAENGF